MANPGPGTKFVSVNLNKSYGQQQYHHNNQHHSSSYGSNRTRPGGGGGGMVVLSRPRSSQKAAGPKLSVPPPLNLPSLRKEHERFDSLGSGGGSGGVGSGGAPRPSSSGVGWTKTAAIAMQEKEGPGIGDDHTVDDSGNNHGVDQELHAAVNGATKGSNSSAYMPPSARSAGTAVSGPSQIYPVTVKATLLRGEDFPSLKATLPATAGPEKKQKDSLNQRQKQLLSEELANDQIDGSDLSMLVDMRPQLHSRSIIGNELDENGGENRAFGGSIMSKKGRKQEEYFPGPLPLVRLNPRLDWADDERDTGHGITDWGRDYGVSKSEAYGERDFDFPRPSILPQKPANNLFDRWGQRDNETGKISSSEVTKVNNYSRDMRASSRDGREGNSWRASSPLSKDGFGSREVENERNGIGVRPSNLNREVTKENKYIPSPFRDNSQDDTGRKDAGYGQGGRQPWNIRMDSFGSQGPEWNTRERHRNEQYNRYRGDPYQNIPASKSSFSLGGKGIPINDPILNFGREKSSFSKSEKPYLEDPFMKDFRSTSFDGRDPFSGGLIGLVKKKKDVLKRADFHDPVRESFEAELERVQKLQEQERQRIIEEQERATERARREEEERMQSAREQEEQQRRLEEEAREAAWRAEQERLEAMRRAEEHRIAREVEKHRILLEEERRKHAARQKLLELEERIAKRHTESAKGGNNISSAGTDEKMLGMVTEKDVSKVADAGDWEDSERTVERITTSASSDSSGMNRPFEVGSRPHFSRDGSSAFLDRGKSMISWKRDAFDNGNSSTLLPQDQENGHRSPGGDASLGGRAFSRKEFYVGPGSVSSRTYQKGVISDPHMDDFNQIRGQRWNVSGDGDRYNRNTDIGSEFREIVSERFDDAEWGQGHSRANAYPPYHERMYQNPDADGLYSFGRSRYSMRQPRVLPPPSMAPVHRSPYRGESIHPGPSTFSESEMQYNHLARNESPMQTRYNSSHQEALGVQAEIIDNQQANIDNGAQKVDRSTTRCDSQSSLSVSSPPDSPVHFSHDGLDESGDSLVSSSGEGKEIPLLEQGNESVTLLPETERENMMSGSSVVSAGDDEEWTVENDEQLQEQEEYDEDEDGYEEADEVHDGEDENINLIQEFNDMHLEEKGSPGMLDNLVLGFNEGVEVGMPNDEFEKPSRGEENKFVIPQISVVNVEEPGSFDGVCSDGQTFQSVAISTPVGIDNSRIFQETDNATQDLLIQHKNAPQASTAPELMNNVDASGGFGLATQPKVSSSAGQTVMSSASPVPSQPEVPVKLQFGLFSGPSLVPSPVPAIQIGSIQMPLHLHPPVGPTLAHMHPSQPPLFQFGQLRYLSPISQGVLPVVPQSMPFVQSNVPANISLNQNAEGLQPGQDISAHNLMKNDGFSVSMDAQPGLLPQHLDLTHGLVSKEGNSLPPTERGHSTVKIQQGRVDLSHSGSSNLRPESSFQAEDSLVKNFKSLQTRESEGQILTGGVSSQSVSRGKDLGVLKGQGMASGGRGKRYIFTVRNSGPRSSLPGPQASHPVPCGFQRGPRRPRTEFRVRVNADKRHFVRLMSSSGVGDKSNVNYRDTGGRSGSRRVVVSNGTPKQKLESESSNSQPVSLHEMDSGKTDEKGAGKEFLRSPNISISGKDVDAPLQSGIVRVFEQPGIEAPSDDDDFIEVRSKKQMMNDRREQREKEIKAKSRVSKSKMPRKPRSTLQSTTMSAASSKISTSAVGEASNSIHVDFVATEGEGSANIEVSTGFNSPIVSQPLLPIGNPAVKTDAQADMRSQTIKSLQTSSLPVVSGGGRNLASGLIFENKNKVLDNVHTSLGPGGDSRIPQQNMALKQTQLDKAIKLLQFDSHSSIGDPINSAGEASLPLSSILSKNKTFSSATSPINSLLAGEKIQFGAVTSPTILPPSNRAVSHGIGPPGPSRSEIHISHNLSASENDCSLFLEKERQSYETSAHLEVCEAEAEAAASAVAVAAISSDEIVGNRLGTCPVSSAETKNFGSAVIEGVTAGVSGDQQLASQSRAEESLIVSLPADLSVENPPISLWPTLQSPHNSSSQMLSHLPGGPPSHFPFYEMNPIVGGPIFTFGPHDERASTQSQSQKSSVAVSGPLGTWQHHSGIDSFYGPPAGYTGPYISPPGSIPGVQGPPHMVVYNHFAPVEQFGQVGLSYMGTTYIPSGKQPDWKLNPGSSAMGVCEGDMNSLNMVSAQHNPTNIPATIQHLAPGSPLLPMASPLAVFDVSPYESSPDMSVQARWSNVPASSLQSVPVSLPLHQHAEGVLPSQFNHGPSAAQPLVANRFPKTQTPTSSEKRQNFPVAADTSVSQLPDELGLVDTSNSAGGGTSAQNIDGKNLSARTIPEAGKMDTVQNGSGGSSTGQSTSCSFKVQHSHQKNTCTQQYSNSSGYSYQRGGGASQKNIYGGEWSHRNRMGYQGRNQPLGAEKGFPPSKMRQIYVAKQTNGTSRAS